MRRLGLAVSLVVAGCAAPHAAGPTAASSALTGPSGLERIVVLTDLPFE